MTKKRRLPWAWIGGLGALAVGLVDGAIFLAMGLEVTVGSSDPTLLMSGTYVATIAFLGYVAGRLYEARLDLQESQARILQAEKLASIGRLAAGVAHEVRNPLGVMRAAANLAQGAQGLTEDQAKALSFIVQEVDRLDHFVRTLLDFSRPVAAAKGPLDLAGFLDEVRQRAGVEVELQAEGLGRVHTDEALLSGALLGLVRNAAEAADGARVAIRARRDGRDLVLEVVDDGPGLTAEDLEAIFEPFFTTKARGTGLGLPMASRTAEALGGSLEAVVGHGLGANGRGACFRLRLPGAAGKEAA